MRQRIWRGSFAAIAGLFLLAGVASAQTPMNPMFPSVPAAVAGIPSAPAAVAGIPSAPAPGAVVYQANPGYVTPVAANSGRVVQKIQMVGGGYYCSNCQYAQPCNNGCGSFKADCNFVFGSCKSFFEPCGVPAGAGCHGKKCQTPIYGTGSGPMQPCQYDSYLNH